MVKSESKRDQNRRRLATIDCETDPFMFERVPEPFIWGFYDGNFISHRKTEEFVRFISEQNVLAYAHNGGKFDFHFLLEYASEGSIKIINGRIAQFKIGKALFRDSLLILPVPLASMNKSVIDYEMFEVNERQKHMDEIIDYLFDDCRFLFDEVKKFRDTYGNSLTLPGAALKFYKNNYNENIPHSTKEYHQYFQPYYYGGRVEVFKPGIHNEPLQYIDINSAYPFAMTHQHPITTKYSESTTLKDNNIESSFVHCTCISKGALPFRDEHGGLQFPNDNILREYFVSGWELKKGLELNCISKLKIIKVNTFRETISFTDYVNHFYELKKNAVDKSDKLHAKLFLNSLYGKFATNPDNFWDYRIIDNKDRRWYSDNGWDNEGPLATGTMSLVAKPIKEESKQYFNLATAASITGFVRAFMFEAIHNADGVVYCDTDSIVCKSHKASVGDELGQWELEGTFKEFGVGGKKMYAGTFLDESEKTACKGCRITYNQIMEVAQGKTVLYKPEVPTFSLKTGITFTNRTIRKTC